jgi:hypothetical protein
LLYKNYNRIRQKGQDLISDFLNYGKANAITSQRLADLAGCKSVRDLQELIAAERSQGAVILSTCRNGGGYYLPENATEVTEFVKTLTSRARNTLIALDSARAYLRDQEGEVQDGES